MKPKRALLLTTIAVLLLCAACGVWLHKEGQQYARNRQLIAALAGYNAQQALALINAGADPNTRAEPMPAPSFKRLMNHLLHHTLPPVNHSPTAFMIACGMQWNPMPGRNDEFTEFNENFPLLQAMLSHGADVDALASDKHTAVYAAAGDNRLRTVELLLQHGAKVNIQDILDYVPLSTEMSDHTAQIIRLLVAYCKNLNAQDNRGNSALHYAIDSDSCGNIVAALLTSGADPNLPNEDGETPLMLAQKMKRADFLRLFKRGAK